MNFDPHFTEADYANMFPIRANAELNNSEQGYQVLYSEIDFPFIAASLAAEGNEAYAYGYDGYAFYQTMSWDSQSANAENEGRGLFTAILDPPGYAGWVCFRNSDGEYDCKAQYLAAGGLDDNATAPDLTKDDYDADPGWLCRVDTETSEWKDQAECVYFMPIEADSYPRGSMRWSPYGLAGKQVDNIPQVGFVGQTNVKNNSWHYLGIVQFQGAVALAGATIATLASMIAF